MHSGTVLWQSTKFIWACLDIHHDKHLQYMLFRCALGLENGSHGNKDFSWGLQYLAMWYMYIVDADHISATWVICCMSSWMLMHMGSLMVGSTLVCSLSPDVLYLTKFIKPFIFVSMSCAHLWDMNYKAVYRWKDFKRSAGKVSAVEMVPYI